MKPIRSIISITIFILFISIIYYLILLIPKYSDEEAKGIMIGIVICIGLICIICLPLSFYDLELEETKLRILKKYDWDFYSNKIIHNFDIQEFKGLRKFFLFWEYDKKGRVWQTVSSCNGYMVKRYDTKEKADVEFKRLIDQYRYMKKPDSVTIPDDEVITEIDLTEL